LAGFVGPGRFARQSGGSVFGFGSAMSSKVGFEYFWNKEAGYQWGGF
jgi:hypothetical protein